MDEMTHTAAGLYYDSRYEMVFERMASRSAKLELGDRRSRRCRFCDRSPPEVTFRSIAHAIPESLGNRGLTSAYECDACNDLFGKGIENDLGEWSKPSRTFARIAGKSGVPTLKESSKGGWRIEYKEERLDVRSYESDPLYELDEADRRVTFTLKRGSYTPVAVFKAFVKIGLTLIPAHELSPFSRTLAWARDTDHARSWLTAAPLIHTFQNGPMPSDRLVALVLRRRPDVTEVPYAFLVLGYGNDVFQIVLPAPMEDAGLSGQRLRLVPFPTPGGSSLQTYGWAKPTIIDMSGREVVRGEVTKVRLGYESATRAN